MSCKHNCAPLPLFPREIDNRPGLSRIEYRIGTYADVRGHLLASLNAPLALAAWTHREPDDPAIALLEASSIVADVLTLYQELYANEAYLRTARWRESVADLVRHTGYHLAPGLGGRATFALLTKGAAPVTVPKALRIKAQLEPEAKRAEFETVAEASAVPTLSRFNLYRPAASPSIAPGQSTFAIPTASLEAQHLALRKGDRVMLAAHPSQTAGPHQIAVVADLRQRFEHTEIAIEGAWNGGAVSGPLTAYKLGRSFRHFGNSAPSSEPAVENGASVSHPVSFSLPVAQPSNVVMLLIAGVYTWRPGLHWLALDQEVDDLAAGRTVLTTLQLSTQPAGVGAEHLVERRIRTTRKVTAQWGRIDGGATAIELDQSIAANPPLAPPPSGGGPVLWLGEALYSDLRTIEIHEVEGTAFHLTAARTPGGFNPSHLAHFGTQDAYLALQGRRLQFVRDSTAEATVAGIDAAAATQSGERLRPVALNPPLSAFGAADFPWEDPPVTVYGNLVDASQGKTEDALPLGDGDARQTFQTFLLPKAPLTYQLDPAREPRYRPELELRVDGILWQAVDTLFGRAPDAHVYVVREDAEGKSYVQFGDGESGARLPTGRNTVVARYRTGHGANGPVKLGAKPQAAGRVIGLDAIAMPAPATGGAQPEHEENARTAAPARLQSLGRLVSLADYESEALLIPGVLKARADWAASDAAPVIRIVILTDSNAPEDAAAVADTLRAVTSARGPARFPFVVVIGQRLPVALSVQAGFDSLRREEDVRRAILEALGATGQEGNGVDSSRGLFSWQRRRFGQGVHSSQIVAAVQNATGVRWARLLGAGVTGATVPGARRLAPPRQNLLCSPLRLLTLTAADLTLALSRSSEEAPS